MSSSTAAPLDDRLVQAALDALASTAADSLSLRQVAQSVGVSHQAPYVRFGSKRRFLAAVAGVGLQRAAEEAAAAVEAAGDDPLDRLEALSTSYLTFIRERPHVHDLAYGPTVAKRDHPLLQQAAIDYWDLLRETVAACQPPGTAEEEVLRRCAAAWGTVYGIARLDAFEQIPESVPRDVTGLVRETLTALAAGWQSTGRSASAPTGRHSEQVTGRGRRTPAR